MKRSTRQYELRAVADEFNLVSETGDDPLRLLMEKLRAERARDEARQYEAKMQRQLSECPGFIGVDAPRGPESVGKVVVDPGRISEAMAWLGRRFKVSENLELSHDQGLCVEIISRTRANAGRRKRASFGKVEQFQLAL
jgi:hypothetical protein